ncbi:MAG TPA: sensor domain-containing diguanylate cyclase, partial [Gammaproteobacteria bacterium]|nr:sensor domain-containing diguanylate cyclase [Gammaproteobacteria bacterium]
EVQCMPDPETGKWLTVVGAADIADRKAYEDELQTERQRMQTLVANLRGAVFLEDEDRRVVLVNQAFCDTFGVCYGSEDLLGMDARPISREVEATFADPMSFRERTDATLDSRYPVMAEEFRLADGRIFERDYIPIFLADRYRGHLWQYWDVTDRKAHEQNLQELANTDAVTGLPNRRHVIERMEEEVARVARSGETAMVMLVDLDHFKAINDTYGHAVGDEALIRFSKVLRRELRGADVVGRIGGDEFLLILPLTDEQGAQQMARRLHTAAARLRVPCTEGQSGLSLSIGLTPLEGEIGYSRRILMRADAALYQVKSQGRGATISVTGDSPQEA